MKRPFKAKADPEEVERENENNEWLRHLEGEHEAPLAAKQGAKKKGKTKISLRQQRATRSK